jgi:CRISPR-associated protein Cmr5
MQLARCRVNSVAASPNENVRTTYGGLCHEFPVMVRTCGLCQAVAFSLDKAQSNEAHSLLLDDLSKVLGVDRNQLAGRIEAMNTTEYMLATRQVLSAWLFFKRFAVSILKVKTGQDAQGG